MEESERRVRRWHGRSSNIDELPVSVSIANNNNNHYPRSSSSSLSCSYTHNTRCSCYCDHKIFCLNSPLFRFGRRHSSFLILWFSIGVGFSLTALLVVSVILLWELGSFLHLFPANTLASLLFGLSPSLSPWSYGLRLSFGDAPYLFLSTLLSVSVHEFGHAIAAASEGVPMEYIAIFLALLFPGALVAFNSELLLALQHIAALRVYCAGIWHNAVFCAACGLALFLLPLIVWPFCIHGERVMVLDVESTSPLSGYLSPGDIIVSLDGKSIHNVQQWKETITLIHEWTLHASNHSQNFEHLSMVFNRKGYCVPQPMIANSYLRYPMYDQSACPDGLTDFRGILCVNSSKLDDVTIEEGYLNRRESRYCLNATDVIKLNKCGDVWVAEGTIGSKCSCSQDLLCMSPVQLPGLTWIEINYRSPYSAECLNPGTSSFKTKNTDFIKQNCGGTFVFVGDLISMANSVQVTGYEPRWPFTFTAYLPAILQKILTCAFHVSLTLALLNSLPVFFLDGESILEVALCQFTLLTPRKKEKVLRASLIGGTLISILAVMRVFTSIIFL